MTPAEKLAARKKRKRAANNTVARSAYPRASVWHCAIREARESLNLSMHDVAEAINLSVSSLHAIEHGSDPMLTTARRIAAFFGKDTNELWPKERGEK